MRKFLLALFVCMFAVTGAWADVGGTNIAMVGGLKDFMNDFEEMLEERNAAKLNDALLVFELDGELYYAYDLEKLLSGELQNSCVYGRTDGKIKRLYEILLDNCREELSRNVDRLSGDDYKKSKWEQRVTTVQDMFMGRTEDALLVCLVNAYLLRERLQNVPVEVTNPVTLQQNLDACVSKIGVMEAGIDFNGNQICPVGFKVRHPEYLDNLANLDARFTGTDYKFLTSGDVGANPLMAVFNGYVMVVCDGAEPVELVQFVGSGADVCQGNVFQSIPSMGSLPQGVYLARHQDIQNVALLKSQGRISTDVDWGAYRIPLIPSAANNTYGRGSFYLHGSDKDGKYQSAGCITLGTGIADFVERFLEPAGRDMIIVVDTVDVVNTSLRDGDWRAENLSEKSIDGVQPGWGMGRWNEQPILPPVQIM